MSNNEPWPPEGTRVRILQDGNLRGIVGYFVGAEHGYARVYVGRVIGDVLFYRHEIEVIEDVLANE